MAFLEGFRTYTGIAVLALAYLLEGYATREELEGAVTALLAVIGTALAVYGRYKAKKK